MATEEKKAVRKKTSTKSSTAKKKAPAKKPAGTAAKKKTPAKKTAPKTGSSTVKKKRKDIPAGLSIRNESGSANLDHSIVTNKQKKKKRSSKKYSPERVFWTIIIAAFVLLGVSAIIYIFADYNNESATPAQLNTPEISKEEVTFVTDITNGIAAIEDVKVTEQGPIIYVIYTVPAGTTKEEISKEISTAYSKALEANAGLFEKYSFQLTIVNSGEEADGVNDYPFMGSLNIGRTSITWMAIDGNYAEPEKDGE